MIAQQERAAQPDRANDILSVLSDGNLARKHLVPQYTMHVFPDMAYVFPPPGQLSWGVENRDAPKNRKFRPSKFAKHETHLNLRRMNSVNGTAKDLYLLADGLRTGEDIYLALLAKHNQPYGTMQKGVYEFLREMALRGHVRLSDEPHTMDNIVTGSEEFHHPPHLSIEVTSLCNIACVHCYGTFEQTRFDAIDADKLIALMEDMKKHGFSSVELTGGECTTHPEFPRILRWCCENLHMVGVLTNAVRIREEIFELLEKHSDRVLVQICINGNEEYHNKFTKSSFAYRRAMDAVSRLTSAGVYVRTPMNVTFENVDQIEETIQAVRDAGSCGWSMNLVDYDYGRAAEILTNSDKVELAGSISKGRTSALEHTAECEKQTPEGHTCVDRMREMLKAMDMLKDLAKKYPSFVTGFIEGPVKDQMDWEKSCGAGRRTVYIASNGRVGLCPMSVETGIPGFGDLRSGNLGSVMQTEFAKHMASVPAPNDTDCVGPDGEFCPHRFEHRGCILHGVMQYMKTPRTCWWGQKHDVQKLIDTGSHSLTKKPDGSWDLPELTHKGSGCGHSLASKEQPQPALVELGVRR